MLALPAILSACVRDHSARASTPACLAGMYDGGQMELAAALELDGGGRFRFALSYGALDEMAEGTWRFAKGVVHLTTTSMGPGTAAFENTPLAYEEGTLSLPRHGRLLRFRRMGPDCKGGS